MHAFKPDQAWGLQAIKDNLRNLKWSRSRVREESGGPKIFLTPASHECTVQRQSFPENPHRRCGPILHMCRHVKVAVLGCVQGRVCSVPCSHSVFQDFFSFTTWTQKKIIKLSKGVLRSGNCGVAAKLCLEEPAWPPLPKERVTQRWGRPEVAVEIGDLHGPLLEVAFYKAWIRQESLVAWAFTRISYK